MDEVLSVARQPILDSRNGVYGYELLYRSAQDDHSFSGRPSQASARILSESIAGLDLDVLCDERRAFLNMLPATPEVVQMCRSLRRRGYGIALGDFVPGTAAEALIEYATCGRSMCSPSLRRTWRRSRSGCRARCRRWLRRSKPLTRTRSRGLRAVRTFRATTSAARRRTRCRRCCRTIRRSCGSWAHLQPSVTIAMVTNC